MLTPCMYLYLVTCTSTVRMVVRSRSDVPCCFSMVFTVGEIEDDWRRLTRYTTGQVTPTEVFYNAELIRENPEPRLLNKCESHDRMPSSDDDYCQYFLSRLKAQHKTRKRRLQIQHSYFSWADPLKSIILSKRPNSLGWAFWKGWGCFENGSLPKGPDQ